MSETKYQVTLDGKELVLPDDTEVYQPMIFAPEMQMPSIPDDAEEIDPLNTIPLFEED